MPAAPKHRDAIVDAAIRLFRQNGYAATGLNEIVNASGAPKGSLYHYFPKGKASIAEAAISEAGRRVVATIDEIAARTCSTSALLREHAILLARWMEESDFRDGCPITTALLELAPNDRDVTAAGKMAYDTRLERLSSMLVNDGREEQSARRLACLCISVIQGSLIQARVERSGHPIMIAADELARLLEA